MSYGPQNVCRMVHKIHFIFEYLHLNPGFIFKNTQLFRICISLLIMYSNYMVIVLDTLQGQLQDVAAVKQELNVELATEEHQLCLRR